MKDTEKLVLAYENYIKILEEELYEVVLGIAHTGWKSSRVEAGEQARKQITELKKQYYDNRTTEEISGHDGC